MAVADWLLETLQKPARWVHPTAPSNARSVAIAADRAKGEIMIEGVGEDSGESEGRAAGVGDGRVERGISKFGNSTLFSD